MKKTLFLFVLLPLLILSCNPKTEEQSAVKTGLDSWDSLLLAQGTIQVYEPLRFFVGETDSTNSVYTITLQDIEKYHGKVCPGMATGFQMFRDVLQELYPGEIPVRGQVAVASSRPSDLFDVAGYILGIRNFYGRSELGKGMLIVDTSLATGVPKQFVMIFKRLDNGKTLKVTFNKFNLMDQNDWPLIDEVTHKYENCQEISQGEMQEFKEKVHNEVLRTLTQGVRENTYIIEQVDNYVFPFEEKH